MSVYMELINNPKARAAPTQRIKLESQHRAIMVYFNALLLFIASAALASTRAAVLTGAVSFGSGTTTIPTTVATAPITTPTVVSPSYYC
ncbi:hypothetical protein B0H11DRAFT_2234254 [Mycena galericulata]|nr:hypothetical protein B0H11DRAFT_2234254 [Mycena galericulata]